MKLLILHYLHRLYWVLDKAPYNETDDDVIFNLLKWWMKKC